MLPHELSSSPFLQNLMAKALYDNVPESPEELAFRKGDILTVIEQNTGGLEGWWLCSLHGRQGIAPGNRLKLLIGPMFESPSPAATPSPPQGHQQRGGAGAQGLYQVPPDQQSVYQVPPRGGLSAENTPSKVRRKLFYFFSAETGNLFNKNWAKELGQHGGGRSLSLPLSVLVVMGGGVVTKQRAAGRCSPQRRFRWR